MLMKKEDLFRLLKEGNVDYVVIGAMAFPVHGYARATLDLDIFIRPTIENAEKVRSALEKFGYDVHEVTAKDLLENKVLIRQYLLEYEFINFTLPLSHQALCTER